MALSGLEMSPNQAGMSWSEEALQNLLMDVMRQIHDRCVEHGLEDSPHVDYVRGANIAGFEKVARAMLAFGVV